MSAPSDRLRRARIAAGFRTATDAARSLGVSRDTYLQHENGTRGYDDDAARLYARRFRTTPAHLKFGRGPEGEAVAARIIGRVGADPSGEVIYSDADQSYDTAPLPPGATGPVHVLEVAGHSMRGLADDGSLIYFEDQKIPPSEDMLGHVVVAEVEDGLVLLKRLLRGSRGDVFDLESINGPTLKDQRVVWVAHVTDIVPPWKARQIVIRANS